MHFNINPQIDFFKSEKQQKVRPNKALFEGFPLSSYKKNVSNGIVYFTGEFWTSRQRQAHRLHELSYRACFKPQLPAFFIEQLTQPGDVVYDPFMGRGTTLISALLKDRIPYGNDINPLSRVLTEPRIGTPSLNQIYARLSEIPWKSFKTIKNKDLLVFFHPRTLAQIEGLKVWLKNRQKKALWDQTDRWIQMVAVNRLTGHSAGFFSVYTMPPNQAVSLKQQKKINQKRGEKAPSRDVPALIFRKSKTLLSQGGTNKPPHCLLLTQEAYNTPQILSNSVKLVVTSPPFLDTVNYVSDNWLRCWFLGINLKSLSISQYKNIDDWSIFIQKTLKELSRITCVGGHIAFEVGEVRAGTIQLEKHVLKQVQGLPLKVLSVLVNEQKFTKTANCWGISNNKKGTNSNRIVLLEKIK